MKLLVARLSDAPRAHCFEAGAAFWEAAAGLRSERPPEVEERPTGALRFDVRAHRMGEDIYVEGEASGALDLVCSRCLARYRHSLREPFRVVLESAGTRVPPDPEGAAALERDGLYLGDELETGWFRGDVIHLDALLREVVALALPVKPLCKEDCQGLCPMCGVDRNVSLCQCEQRRPDSPFAVLRVLRGAGSSDGSTGGG